MLIRTNHDSSAFGVDSQELSGDNAPAAALPKRFLVDLLEHVFGRVIFQDDNATTVTSYYDVIYRYKHKKMSVQHTIMVHETER